MKNVLPLLLILFLSLSLVSCDKEDDDGDNTQAQITADINGVPWEAATSVNIMRKLTPAGNPPHTQLTISGYAENQSSTISLIITDYKDKGLGDCVRLTTFLPAGAATDTAMWNGIPLNNTSNPSFVEGSQTYSTITDGEITITACDGVAKTITGTFEFVGITSGGDTVRVTNGKIKGVSFSAM